MDVTGYEFLDDQAIGTGPYSKSPCEQPVFHGQVPTAASGAQALMQSLAAENWSKSMAQPVSTTDQTFNACHALPVDDPSGHSGNTRFPTHFIFTAPRSGGTASFPEMTSVGE